MAFIFSALVLFPISALLILIWTFTGKKIFGQILAIKWIGIISLLIIGGIIQKYNSKVELEKEDYYGEYVINRNYFPGEQADWQYNNFRFWITSGDIIYFYVTDKDKILKTYKGTISTVKPYSSERLVIHMEQPTHHILSSNPTIYRDNKGFYLVFNSPKFHNVYFIKGKWKPIN